MGDDGEVMDPLMQPPEKKPARSSKKAKVAPAPDGRSRWSKINYGGKE